MMNCDNKNQPFFDNMPSFNNQSVETNTNEYVPTTQSTYEIEDQTQVLKELGLSPVWAEVTQDYQILKKIGKGSFGTVVEARCRHTGVIVAIKCVEGFAQYDYDCVKLVREI